MSFLSLLLLAIGLSMDAFAVSISQGASQKQAGWKQAVRSGLIFGLLEGITPLIGWIFGLLANSFIAQWSLYLAFILLLLLGGRMLYAGVRGNLSAAAPDPSAPAPGGLWLLILTAIATSIDALAIGMGLAFLQVNIFYAALTIGLVSAIFATLGIATGRLLGTLLGRWAEIIGGLVLIGIGGQILLNQLMG